MQTDLIIPLMSVQGLDNPRHLCCQSINKKYDTEASASLLKLNNMTIMQFSCGYKV